MTLPDRQDIANALLQLLSDGRDHQASDYVEALANRFNLSAEERERAHAKSGQPIFYKDVMFTRLKLKDEGCISIPRYGYIRITDEGRRRLNRTR